MDSSSSVPWMLRGGSYRIRTRPMGLSGWPGGVYARSADHDSSRGGRQSGLKSIKPRSPDTPDDADGSGASY